MVISDILVDGRLTFKTYFDKGREGLKSEDFLWEVIYGWPLTKSFESYLNKNSDRLGPLYSEFSHHIKKIYHILEYKYLKHYSKKAKKCENKSKKVRE